MESAEHLYLPCPFAPIIWRMAYFTYNIPPPTDITNMFGKWLKGINKVDKASICLGVSALYWSTWTCRNNIVSKKQKDSNFLQVVWLAN
jgi:hypothetical protein